MLASEKRSLNRIIRVLTTERVIPRVNPRDDASVAFSLKIRAELLEFIEACKIGPELAPEPEPGATVGGGLSMSPAPEPKSGSEAGELVRAARAEAAAWKDRFA